MFIIISPAKTLDFETKRSTEKHSEIFFRGEMDVLVSKFKKLSAKKIGDLMHISEALAQLNKNRYDFWPIMPQEENTKQAILAFKGDVYIGLEAEKFTATNFDFAQKNLRILSGLYGLLKPLDLIHPYRLEMGTQLKIANKINNIYQFWGSKITLELARQMEIEKSDLLINLCSAEYFKAIQPKVLGKRIITCEFKEAKGGEYKIIGFFAKKARGMMAAYIIKNKIKTLEKLKKFNASGYVYNDRLSNENTFVFTR
jgi:uncharacterized protein